MEKKTQLNLWYLAAAAIAILLFQAWWTSQTYQNIEYSRFERLLKDKQIEEIAVRSDRIEGKLKTPINGKTLFITQRVDTSLASELAKYDVKFRGVQENTVFSTLLSWMLPILFFFALWAFFFRNIAEKQGLGGMMNVGKSKAKVYVETETGVTLDDVAGVDEAKEELEEVVNFLKNPEDYGRLGARIPKGILLVGPPGTGKTLLARAVAGEAGVPFFSISGSEFVEMFVGVGAARVRDLFEQARKNKPCIIFIDELDSLGSSRGNIAAASGNSEKEQTLNQLLNELDGFDPREGVVLLSATNRPEVLDAALTRAGRFDRQIAVDRPDRDGRKAILQVHARKIRAAPNVEMDEIAAITPGFSGADLANLVNEAALVATRRSAVQVTKEDFTKAVERIVAGVEKKSRLMNEDERRTVAYHEMGHALVASGLEGTDPVHKVSIIPRGVGALGYTMQRPTEDRYLISTQTLKNKMAVLMGGRAAEELIFNEISTGAADDINRATDIARQMVARFGMNETLGQAVYMEQQAQFLPGEISPGRHHSEETAREIDLAVRNLIDEAYERAKNILTKRSTVLEEGTKLLLEKETLTPDEFPPLVHTEPATSKAASSKASNVKRRAASKSSTGNQKTTKRTSAKRKTATKPSSAKS